MTRADDPVGGDEIRALDEQTIERIAAGEVVERPASVVKELVENSLDAGASRIQVEVADGGTERIRVSDDGVGMTERAVRKAVQQHTTSKLREIDDLHRGVATLGFRGEALYTIAAVSRLTITTRPSPGDADGTELRAAGGTVESIGPAGCPPGTTVSVTDLFYNTPARRAFLGAPETEFDHVNRIVANYALANPDVAMSLHHDGREVFSTPGQGDLRGAVLAVYGREVAESMIDVEATFTDGPLERIHGLVSDPETTRSRPRYVSTFVNGRYVRSTRLRGGILDAYGGQLAPDRYPFVVLFCTVPPDSVDVNVHPRKTEVRFEAGDAVAGGIEAAVEDALLEAGLIRTTAPRGSGAPAETTVAPEGSAEGVVESSHEEVRRGGQSRDSSGSDRATSGSAGFTSTTETPPEPDLGESLVADDRKFRAATRQRTFDGDAPTPSLSSLPRLELLGQLGETYLVAAGPSGLILVDQHAADERINFERLRDAFREEPGSQRLVEPVACSLTADEAAAFPRVRTALERLGFDAALEDRTLRITAVPTVFERTIEPERIRDAVGSALDRASASAPVEAVADALLADMACHPSITGNTALAEGSMVDLLEALDDCENPYACPHGRPVIVQIDESELEDRFERDYPGHATRRPE